MNILARIEKEENCLFTFDRIVTLESEKISSTTCRICGTYFLTADPRYSVPPWEPNCVRDPAMSFARVHQLNPPEYRRPWQRKKEDMDVETRHICRNCCMTHGLFTDKFRVPMCA